MKLAHLRHRSLIIASGAVLATCLAAATGAWAGVVSGILKLPSGNPAPGTEIHLEEQVSGDVYIIESGRNGAFSVDVPAGTYDLRAADGAPLRTGIAVRFGARKVELGAVVLPTRRSFGQWLRGLFERERIAPALVTSPAPAGAPPRDSVPPSAASAKSSGAAKARVDASGSASPR